MRWLKKNWFASICLLAIGWLAHYSLETFIVNNVLALLGYKTPTLVMA